MTVHLDDHRAWARSQAEVHRLQKRVLVCSLEMATLPDGPMAAPLRPLIGVPSVRPAARRQDASSFARFTGPICGNVAT